MDSYDELLKLYEEWQKDKEKETKDWFHGNIKVLGDDRKLVPQMLYMMKRKNEVNKEILHQASKSFAKQYKKSGKIREHTHIMLLELTLMTELLDKSTGLKTKRLSAACRKKLESRGKLKGYLDDVKLLIMTEGAQKLSKYPWVYSLEINKRKSKIELDITTTNLFELFKKIHTGLKYSDEFPYNSSQSLGQVIRHHRDALEREGLIILTERRESTHLLITYPLTKNDLWCIRNRKQWIEENKPK